MRRVLPPAPPQVQGALAQLQIDRLRAQAPLLNVTLSLIIVLAMLTATGKTPVWIRIGIPLFIMAFGSWRSVVWSRRRGRQYDDRTARALIRRAGILLTSVGALCSFWAVYTWFADSSDYRQYAAMFLAMGTFATTYCLSVVRGVSIANLLVSMGPMTGVLLLSGDQMPTALGGCMAIGMAFLVRLIQQQHDQSVEMLLLQQQMHELARIDPLTGLLNRRALFEELEAAIGEAVPDRRPAVAILDLDNFKPVNDGYGHAIGDKLLQQVAGRLNIVCGSLVRIARLGGDEFAILAARADHRLTADIVASVEAAINLPFQIDDLQIRVGVSSGLAIWSSHHVDLHCLLAEADEQLYAAKSRRGGHGMRRSHFRALRR